MLGAVEIFRGEKNALLIVSIASRFELAHGASKKKHLLRSEQLFDKYSHEIKKYFASYKRLAIENCFLFKMFTHIGIIFFFFNLVLFSHESHRHL